MRQGLIIEERSVSKVDVVVVGAGHNGLVAACYLAKAGRKVAVLEVSPRVGGMTSTNAIFEKAPNHRINEGGMDVTLLRASSIVRDLELKKFGFGEIEVDPPYAFLQPDGSSLCLWKDPVKTADELRRFSPRDAEAYLEFANYLDTLMTMVLPYMVGHPTRPNIGKLILAAAKTLAHPKRIPPLTRFMTASHAEYLAEAFDSEMIRGPLSAIPCFLPMDLDGTAWVLVGIGMVHRIGVSRIRGGTGTLTDSLARCFQALGGVIRTSTKVEKILVEGGAAVGVVLESGEELRASNVLTSCNVKYALTDLLPSGVLERKEEVQARHIPIAESSASFKVDIALDGPAKLSRHEAWRGDGLNLSRPGLCWTTYDEHRAAWKACARHQLPRKLPGFTLIPSSADPTQAPAGKDTLWYWSGIVPTHPDESWLTLTHKAEAAVNADLALYFDNVADIEIARRVMSPLELAERFTVPNGHVYHVDMNASRFGASRPAPSFSGFRVPSVKNLYVSGGGMHPSSGICGIPGQLAAQTLLRHSR